MWKMTTLLFSALAFVALASCAGASSGSADARPGLAGVVAAVQQQPAVTRVTVEAAAPAGPTRETFVLLVRPGTEILIQRADGTAERGRSADLVVGARVQAEHTGAELRSLPPQYEALRIRVLSAP